VSATGEPARLGDTVECEMRTPVPHIARLILSTPQAASYYAKHQPRLEAQGWRVVAHADGAEIPPDQIKVDHEAGTVSFNAPPAGRATLTFIPAEPMTTGAGRVAQWKTENQNRGPRPAKRWNR